MQPRFRKALSLAMSLVALVLATRTTAALTPAESACQLKASRVMVKFGRTVAKCGIRCQQSARAGHVPYTDCLAPYGGAMAACLTDPVRGAQPKAVAAFRRACDPAVNPKADCPACYSGGDCATHAVEWVAFVQGQLDSLGPGIYCDPGVVPGRARCMDGVVRSLSTLGMKVHRCYDKCIARQRAGSIPAHSCDPPATDPVTSTCTTRAETKSVAGIDKACTAPVGEPPDCEGDSAYPDGQSWTTLFSIGAQGNVPIKYCE